MYIYPFTLNRKISAFFPLYSRSLLLYFCTGARMELNKTRVDYEKKLDKDRKRFLKKTEALEGLTEVRTFF